MKTLSEIDYASFSIKGKNHRRNEDRSITLGGKAELVRKSGKGQIFAVFDGMGSAPKGAEAAQFMCDKLIEFFKNNLLKADSHQITEFLYCANLEINGWGCIEGTQKEVGGCAGTAIRVDHEDLYVYHVGDTCCLLLKADYENEDDHQVLTTDQAVGDALLAFWGMGKTLDIETWKLKIEECDVLVIVTDGVTKAIPPKSMAADVRKWIRTSAEFAAQSLCKKAERMGSTDDITAVVIEIVEIE